MLLLSFFSRADSQLKPENTGQTHPLGEAICSDVCGAFEPFLEIYQAGLDELLDHSATNQVADFAQQKKLGW